MFVAFVFLVELESVKLTCYRGIYAVLRVKAGVFCYKRVALPFLLLELFD